MSATPARVLIVDDSRIFRAALEEALADQPDVRVVGSVFTGEKAVEFVRATPPDVVTLDVEMPGQGGLATLAELQKLNAARPPHQAVGVVMVSAHTRAGAEVTLQALRMGAFDFVAKPAGPDPAANAALLREELLARVRAFVARRASSQLSKHPPTRGAGGKLESGKMPRPRAVRAVAVAASTGGPRALEVVLPDLCRRLDVPVFVVQHMPPPFTRSLADSLSRLCHPAGAVEAAEGVEVRPRTVYVAPGGRHMVVRSLGGRVLTGLTDQPPENGFKPSADVLFRSAAAAFDGAVVAVVLTGLKCGRADGLAGLGPVKRAGGAVVAQDEGTSVAWGMPGAVVEAGLADLVLPVEEIAAGVARLAGRP